MRGRFADFALYGFIRLRNLPRVRDFLGIAGPAATSHMGVIPQTFAHQGSAKFAPAPTSELSGVRARRAVLFVLCHPLVVVLGALSLGIALIFKLLGNFIVHAQFVGAALYSCRFRLAAHWVMSFLFQTTLWRLFDVAVYVLVSLTHLIASDYETALNVAMSGGLAWDIGLVGLLTVAPWRRGSRIKIATFARFNKFHIVRVLARMGPSRDDSALSKKVAPARCSASLPEGAADGLLATVQPSDGTEFLQYRDTAGQRMLTFTSMGKGGAFTDVGAAHVVELQCAGGADVDATDEDNWTVLMNAVRHNFWLTTTRLVNLGADPNVQASDTGATALHLARRPQLGCLRCLETTWRRGLLCDEAPTPASAFVTLLLEDARTDPCLVDWVGNTAYMSATVVGDVDALRPRSPIAWADVARVLDAAPLDERASALYDLVAGRDARGLPYSAARLRVHDLLFCAHEGTEAELERRRLRMWRDFLRPFTRSVCTARQLQRDEKDMLMHVWAASVGSTRVVDGGVAEVDGRAAYAAELKATLDDTMQVFEAELAPVRDALRADRDGGGAQLCALPAVVPADLPKLWHPAAVDGPPSAANLMAPPQWAVDRDLKRAAVALQQIGVLESAKALCTLLSVGAHRLLPVRERSTFSNASSLDFWLGLVTLWTLGVNELVETEFQQRVKAAAQPGELSIGALKKFPRTFAKAKETIAEKRLTTWEDQVFAPLHIIDILRCTFTVPTAARCLQLGDLLLGPSQPGLPDGTPPMRLIRAKNGHNAAAETVGGYADRYAMVCYAMVCYGMLCYAVLGGRLRGPQAQRGAARGDAGGRGERRCRGTDPAHLVRAREEADARLLPRRARRLHPAAERRGGRAAARRPRPVRRRDARGRPRVHLRAVPRGSHSHVQDQPVWVGTPTALVSGRARQLLTVPPQPP